MQLGKQYACQLLCARGDRCLLPCGGYVPVCKDKDALAVQLDF